MRPAMLEQQALLQAIAEDDDRELAEDAGRLIQVPGCAIYLAGPSVEDGERLGHPSDR